MPRPFCCRRISFQPSYNYFKPRGIPLDQLEEVILTLDELEAIRLADLNSMYQEQAAEYMNVSRPTFGRIIDSAHQKIAQALVNGKALKIETGIVNIASTKRYKCNECAIEIDIPENSQNLTRCPKCGCSEIEQVKQNVRFGYRHRRRWRRGQLCQR